MKGDRAATRKLLLDFVKSYDDATLEEMQGAKVWLTYNEACAALAALNMLEENVNKRIVV